ncbi:hypothetical protein CCACVL1_29586, partial [Corchorus capsularis]
GMKNNPCPRSPKMLPVPAPMESDSPAGSGPIDIPIFSPLKLPSLRTYL